MSVTPDSSQRSDKNRQKSDRRLRRSLLFPFGILAIFVVVLLGALSPLLFKLEGQISKLVQTDVPALEASRRVQRGLDQSVAALRGWIILHDKIYKQDWEAVWKEVIDPAIDELRQSVPAEDRALLTELSDTLDQIETSQWWIADAANAPGNLPARHFFDLRLLPLFEALIATVSEIIDHETQLQLSAQSQYRLMALHAYRDGLGELQRFVGHLTLSPSLKSKNSWQQAAIVLSQDLKALENYQSEFNGEFANALAYLAEMTPIYLAYSKRVIALRQDANWNIALSIMRSESVPLVHQADKQLEQLVARQNRGMNNATREMETTVVWTLISGAGALAVTLICSGLLALRVTNGIAKPLELLAGGVEMLRGGKFEKPLELIGNKQFRNLIDTFNSMSASLKQSKHEVEKHNELLQRSNHALELSNKELDDFAYIASHDLKEPLRGIHNYASFLLEDYEKSIDEEGKDKLQTLMRLTQRMETLIDSLLYFSRVGRQELAVVETNLDGVLDDVIDSLHISLEANEVELIRPGPLPSIVCDAVRVAEVFRNLITNALKYNDKDQKWIEVGVAPKDHVARAKLAELSEGAALNDHLFYVRDNGIGIREKHIGTIFRMFKRLHSRDKYGGGTGAGLTIIKKIIDRHGGKIWVESEFGEGTVFYFTLGK